MTALSVDRGKCVGCRLCESGCPECFVVGDDGIATAKGGKCDTCNLKDVAEGCPVSAITFKE
jgi:ferredoxin